MATLSFSRFPDFKINAAAVRLELAFYGTACQSPEPVHDYLFGDFSHSQSDSSSELILCTTIQRLPDRVEPHALLGLLCQVEDRENLACFLERTWMRQTVRTHEVSAAPMKVLSLHQRQTVNLHNNVLQLRGQGRRRHPKDTMISGLNFKHEACCWGGRSNREQRVAHSRS